MADYSVDLLACMACLSTCFSLIDGFHMSYVFASFYSILWISSVVLQSSLAFFYFVVITSACRRIGGKMFAFCNDLAYGVEL